MKFKRLRYKLTPDEKCKETWFPSIPVYSRVAAAVSAGMREMEAQLRLGRDESDPGGSPGGSSR